MALSLLHCYRSCSSCLITIRQMASANGADNRSMKCHAPASQANSVTTRPKNCHCMMVAICTSARVTGIYRAIRINLAAANGPDTRR